MSAVLALSLCMPGGAVQAMTDAGAAAATQPTATAEMQSTAGSERAADGLEEARDAEEDATPADNTAAEEGTQGILSSDEEASSDGSKANTTRGSPAEEEAVSATDASPVLRALAAARKVSATVTKLSIQNLSGQDANKVYWTDKFYLAMDWDAGTNGVDLHEGDYFDITLPDEMVFPSDSASVDFNIYADDGTTVVATAHVTPGTDNKGGTVRVTFTDWVEGKENVHGNIRLAAQFDRTQVKTGEDNTFQISVSGRVVPVTVNITGPTELKPEIIGKWGQSASDKNQAEWYVRINHQKATLSNVVVSDHLSEGADTETYVADSFVLTRVEMDAYGDVKTVYETVDLTGKLSIAPDGRSFTLNLGDVHGDQYRLYYRTTYTPGTTLRNNMELTSTEQSKTTSATHKSADSGGSGTGDLASKIKLIKVDSEDNAVVLANAVFEVTRPDGTTFELTTGADGTVTSGALTSGTYKVKEKTAPAGYKLNDTEYTLTVNSSGGTLQTVEDKPVKISVSVTKKWIGPEAGPVTVHLLADGVDTGKTLTLSADGGWVGSFDNLRKCQAGTDTAIVYSVSEDPVENYGSGISGDAASGFTITNTNSEKVSVSGAKTWDDDNDRDGVRPDSITVRLLADGAEVASTTATAAGGWAYSFDGLAKYDSKDGHEIAYTVTEDAVPNYATAVAGTAITNSYTPGRTSVTVTKAWDDANDQDGIRPDSVKVQLYADGEPSGDPVELSADNQWTHTWTGLFLKDGGRQVSYTVREVDVPDGYTASVSGDATAGFTVTNVHEPETVSVPVEKKWVGGEGGAVTIRLLADGVDTGMTLSLDKAGNWTGSFDGLPKFKGGKAVTYTVSEDAVEGYASEISGDAASGFTVTNTKDDAPEKPAGKSEPTPKGSLPQTGDEGMLPIALLAAASLVAFFAAALARRRESTARQGAGNHALHQKR